MAFQHKNFNVIAYANGFTLWQYSSNEETLKEIEQDNYFGVVYTLMNNGDIIIITTNKETAMRRISGLDERVVKLGRLQ